MNHLPKIIKPVALLCLFGGLFSACTLHAGIVAASGASDTLSHVKTWSQSSPVEKAQLVCALAGGLALFVAEVWFIVAGFKSSIGWGLFMLFIGGMRSVFCALAVIAWLVRWLWLTHEGRTPHDPLNVPLTILGLFIAFAGTGAIIFIVRHWKHARHPLAVMVLGFLLFLAVWGLNFVK